MSGSAPSDGGGTLASFRGDSEMAARMRAHRWETTPLGPPDRWPQSLLTSVQLILASRHPMFVWWGRQRINLYNDDYIPILGTRHPSALGAPAAEIWSEIWNEVGPLADQVLERGTATWNRDLLLTLQRHGYLEETYFTFSYSPILDEGGEVAGLFCACTEETERVIGVRRMALLQRLSEAASVASKADEAFEECARALSAGEADVPFALFYQWNPDQTEARLMAAAGVTPGSDHAPHVLTAGAAGQAWPTPSPEDGPRLLEGLDDRGLPAEPWPEPARSAKVMPFGRPDAAPNGFAILGLNPRCVIDASYRHFCRTLVRIVGNSAAQAHAFEMQERRLEALAELDRAKTTFFSNISHEFRTPLTLILGPLEDLLAEGPGHERLLPVYRNAQRLLRMVNTLLDFARLSAGGHQARFEAVDASELTRGLVGHFEGAMQRAGLELHCEIEAPDEKAWLDAAMWEKIVLNLLSNALKFTLEGRVTVRRRRDGETLVLEVEYTGVGIPEDEIPHLFRRFHRVRSQQARSFEGTGIGLALVRELAAVHGGEVAVTSRVGQGSRFTVTIPWEERSGGDPESEPVSESATGKDRGDVGHLPYLIEAATWLEDTNATAEGVAAEPPHEDEAAASEAGEDVPLILWADDNPDVRRYVVDRLQPRSRVVTARDGEAALRLAGELGPSLVLADVMMPRLDGFGLARAMRRDPALATTPVILLSARAGEESRTEGFESLADDYLAKPFSSHELLVRIRTQLHTAKLRRRAELDLREAAGRTRSFLAVLGHELRNPISGLANSIEILRRDGSREIEEVRPLIDGMGRQIVYLRRILADLLDASRFQQGTIRLQKREILVAESVADAVAACQDALRCKQIRFELDLGDPELAASVDPVRLEQIVVNLLSNSLKYSDAGGRVSLAVHPTSAEEFEITVEDEGCGIESDDLMRIFDLFSRVRRDDDVEGLGVGLALVRDLAHLHGGEVEAFSDGLGQGSRFVVRLPGRIPALEADTAEEQTAAVESLYMLIVEDNADVAATLAELLELEGHRVAVAGNGFEALERLRDGGRFQVVLLDIDLPDLSGVEVARRMRADGYRGILAATTGFSNDEVLQRAAEPSPLFDQHFVKPIDMAELRGLLATASAQHPNP